MKLMNVLSILICLCGISLIVCAIYIGYDRWNTKDDETNIVDCFDRYKNKIIGAECEEDKYSDISVIIFIVVMGLVMIAISPIMWERWD